MVARKPKPAILPVATHKASPDVKGSEAWKLNLDSKSGIEFTTVLDLAERAGAHMLVAHNDALAVL